MKKFAITGRNALAGIFAFGTRAHQAVWEAIASLVVAMPWRAFLLLGLEELDELVEAVRWGRNALAGIFAFGTFPRFYAATAAKFCVAMPWRAFLLLGL